MIRRRYTKYGFDGIVQINPGARAYVHIYMARLFGPRSSAPYRGWTTPLKGLAG